MCLNNVWKKNRTKQWLEGKPKWIKVHKVVLDSGKNWEPRFRRTPYRDGLNIAPVRIPTFVDSLLEVEYRPYYHFFTSRAFGGIFNGLEKY